MLQVVFCGSSGVGISMALHHALPSKQLPRVWQYFKIFKILKKMLRYNISIFNHQKQILQIFVFLMYQLNTNLFSMTFSK